MSKLAGALPSARPRVSQGTASQQMLLSENALKACASFLFLAMFSLRERQGVD